MQQVFVARFFLVFACLPTCRSGEHTSRGMDNPVRSGSPMPVDPLLLVVSRGPVLDILHVHLWSRHVGGDWLKEGCLVQTVQKLELLHCHWCVHPLKIDQGLHRCVLRVVHPREEGSKGLHRIRLYRRRVRCQIADCEASHSKQQHTWSSSSETCGAIHALPLAAFGLVR